MADQRLRPLLGENVALEDAGLIAVTLTVAEVTGRAEIAGKGGGGKEERDRGKEKEAHGSSLPSLSSCRRRGRHGFYRPVIQIYVKG
jgi:hypothetical protein